MDKDLCIKDNHLDGLKYGDRIVVRYEGRTYGVLCLTEGKEYHAMVVPFGLRVIDDSDEDYLYNPDYADQTSPSFDPDNPGKLVFVRMDDDVLEFCESYDNE